jgi:hypothetical protein
MVDSQNERISKLYDMLNDALRANCFFMEVINEYMGVPNTHGVMPMSEQLQYIINLQSAE